MDFNRECDKAISDETINQINKSFREQLKKAGPFKRFVIEGEGEGMELEVCPKCESLNVSTLSVDESYEQIFDVCNDCGCQSEPRSEKGLNMKSSAIVLEGIRKSSVFLVMGTSSYFREIPEDQVELAKSLGKPFRVLVHQGVQVPNGFSEGVKDYKEKVVNLHNVDSINTSEIKEFLGIL